MADAGHHAAVLQRLKHRRDFLKIAKEGHKVVASTLVLQGLCLPPGEASPPGIQVGFTVTKKVGNAVVRNRIRRRLKSAVSELMPASAMPGCNYVLIGRKAALDAPYAIIQRDLGYGLRKLAKAMNGTGAV